MALNPWHPRFVPFAVYGAFLLPIGLIREQAAWSYPILYVMQCLTVGWLLWRYRRLMPEINFRFHWLAVPVSVLVLFAWVWLGLLWSQFDRVANQEGLVSFTGNLIGWIIDPASHAGYLAVKDAPKSFFEEFGALAWPTLILRLLGMSLLVPVFEELFDRSLILRSLHRLRPTAIGLLQAVQDLPVVGDLLGDWSLAKKAQMHGSVFGHQFQQNALGRLSFVGVFFSTLVFMFSHGMRDWMGAVFCGLAFCLLLAWTNRSTLSPDKRLGLGPIIWAHGLTNALLWGYTLWTNDWQFL